MLTALAILMGIYYYRVFFASILCYIFWNYIVKLHFQLPDTYWFEWFFGLLTIYFIIIIIRGAFGKLDVTVERFLK